MLNKDYIWVFACTALFLITLIVSGAVMVAWNQPAQNDMDVEVSLPIIDWDGYIQLSKHQE